MARFCFLWNTNMPFADEIATLYSIAQYPSFTTYIYEACPIYIRSAPHLYAEHARSIDGANGG